jgi:serine/threonine protein kinase
MKEILLRVNSLHQYGVIHRDLKLGNILLNYKNEIDKINNNILNAEIKIIDFNASYYPNNLQQINGMEIIISEPKTAIGTVPYMSPSVLFNGLKPGNQIPYDKKADIWSLGVLCYEMLVGRNPFSGISMQDVFNKVKIGTYPLPTNLSREVVFFIEGMLQKDHNKRLGCKELLSHDFLTKNVKQFHTMDVRTIPGVVAQQGGLININSGANNNNQKIKNLGETVWDIFIQQPQGINKQHVGTNNQIHYQVPKVQQYIPNQPQNYQVYPQTNVYGQNQVNVMPIGNQYQNNNNIQVNPKMQMGYYYK